MHDQYGFNLRQCNSASTQVAVLKVKCHVLIIVLPTSNEAVDAFEQTITRGFSLVNTRLALDTKILLPNRINEEKKT